MKKPSAPRVLSVGARSPPSPGGLLDWQVYMAGGLGDAVLTWNAYTTSAPFFRKAARSSSTVSLYWSKPSL